MFIITNRNLHSKKEYNIIRITDDIYLIYDDNCELVCINKIIIIGRQYKGVISEKDGTYVEIDLRKTKENYISIIRDHWGGIPIYYYKNKNFIITDSLSEIKKLIGPSVPNYGAVAEYISAAYNVGSRTVYEDINLLLPDEDLILKTDECRLKTKWQVPFKKIGIKDKGSLLKLMEEALTLSIENFVNKEHEKKPSYYLNLSGGTDSSLALSKIKECNGDFNITSLVYYHTDWRSDIVDYEYSKFACDKYDIFSKRIDINNNLYTNAFLSYIDKTKNVLHTYAPSFYLTNNSFENKKASKNIIVNGTGPDESMIGTEKISISKIKELDADVFSNKTSYLVNNIDYLKIPFNTVCNFFRNDKLADLDKSSIDFVEYRKRIAEHVKGSMDSEKLSELQRKYHFYTILQDHIKNIYESCVQSNVGVFFPYLTNDLYIIIFSADFYDLNIGGEYKSIVKEILLKYFPHDYVYRDKIGFQSPSTPYFIKNCGMGTVLRKLLKTDSKIFSSEYSDYIKKQIDNKKQLDLRKRYDYSIWAYTNIRHLEEDNCFNL